jgi:transposase
MRERFAHDGRKVLVCIEQSKGALIYQLMEHDFFVLYPINPSTLSSFREAFHPSGAKSDKSDAELLCELVRLHRDRLKPWKPDDCQTRKLQAFCLKRRKAVQTKVRLVQEIKAELKTYYPFALEMLFGGLDTFLACDFLERWPTLDALRRSKLETIRKFFYAHGCRRVDRLNELLERLPKASNVTSDSAIIEPAAATVPMLCGQLRVVLLAIIDFEKEIASLFDSHPDASIFRSLPGAGPQLAPRLLTAFGSDRQRIESAEQMSVIAGLAPVRKASGKTCIIVRRWACPKFLRQSFHEFAACSIRFCSWAKRFYEAQREKNKAHHTAIRALAFKWMRILFACWKNRTKYDDSLYNSQLVRKGSTFAAQ